jgi:hypothetical protein
MKSLLARVSQKLYLTFLPLTRNWNRPSPDQVYAQVCIDAANNHRAFYSFRRHPSYNRVLEHVSRETGQDYLDTICSDPELYGAMAQFKLNDAYGAPRMYNYPGIGMMSPTTLRYVKVLLDLKHHFCTLNDLSICEIGVGYGGQCRIINALYRPSGYCLVDIRPALALAERFLDNYSIDSTLRYRTMNELGIENADLVISNYAFTELPQTIQDIYFKKVLAGSRSGYITYNEPMTGQRLSYDLGHILKMIPGARVVEERPLTHPNNCIIVWGQCT